TVAGESIINSWGTNPSTGASRFYRASNLANGAGGVASAATTIQTIAPIAFTLKNLYTSMSTPAGSAKSRTSRSYVNTDYGSLSAAMSGDAATSASDTSNSDSIALGDVFWFATDPASNPDAVTWYKFGAT